MKPPSDYSVALDRAGAYRLDRTTEPFPGKIAVIIPVVDRSGRQTGWRLKPLVTMQSSKSRIWPTAADAIASTKLVSLRQAKIAIAEINLARQTETASTAS